MTNERPTNGAAYRLVVRGELDTRFAYLFDGMRMECVAGTTVLTGPVIDQAQLHGFIERFVPVTDGHYDDLRAMRRACEEAGFLSF